MHFSYTSHILSVGFHLELNIVQWAFVVMHEIAEYEPSMSSSVTM
jgi:hypothetical protein